MSIALAGHVKPLDPVLRAMVFYFARLVDGTCLDYQLARESYIRYYTDEKLGGAMSISFALLPMFHHIENCLSNLERAREMGDAIRCRPPDTSIGPLIDKIEWRLADAHEQEISRLRNAIQHQHNDLKGGVHQQAAIEYRPPAELALGPDILQLSHLAKTLHAYRELAIKIIKAIRHSI